MMKQETTEIQTIGVGEDTTSTQPFRFGLTIVYHPDTSRIGEISLLCPVGQKVAFEVSRLQPIFKTAANVETGPINIPHVSRTPIVFVPTPDGGVDISCPKGIPLTIDDGPAISCESLSPQTVAAGAVLMISKSVVLLLHYIDPSVNVAAKSLGMIGHNYRMALLREEILNVADLDARVLIRGESGTGKELVAAAIQRHSDRAQMPYVKVNMTEIPATIAERELFGAAKHAGTGEPGHRGYFQRANGGTIFLDEIGDVDAAVQPKLLRALETGEIQVLGSTQKLNVDVRLIAGTDVDLEAAVESGRFKSSLLQRLSNYTINIPPLRERRDDVGRLFVHFLKEALSQFGEAYKLSTPPVGKRPFFPASLFAKLAFYDWPGNVRQLQNMALRVAIINRGSSKFMIDEHTRQMFVPHNFESVLPLEPRQISTLTEMGDAEILAVLETHGFNLSKASRSLGVERTKFYRHLKQRGIDIESLRKGR